jgi:peptidyl-prolyl cis-trans isomerase B (cyclophilin B)
MSGKRHKREIKAQKRAAREAARRKERQRTIATGVILAVIVALGGVLIWLSLDDPADDDLLADLEEQLEADELDDPAEEEAEGAGAEERPVACGAEEPAGAGEEKPTYPDGPQDVIEPDGAYRAVIATSCGEVVVELDAERTPETVNSFVFLAEEGFYDGLEIFRNEPSIGVLQTGAGNNDAGWDVGYTIPDELEAAEEDGYPPGSVAMANRGPETAGSQFFFVYSDDFGLDPDYARFGTVVEGLDVLEEIGAIPVEGDTPQEGAYLESVTIEEAE